MPPRGRQLPDPSPFAWKQECAPPIWWFFSHATSPSRRRSASERSDFPQSERRSGRKGGSPTPAALRLRGRCSIEVTLDTQDSTVAKRPNPGQLALDLDSASVPAPGRLHDRHHLRVSVDEVHQLDRELDPRPRRRRRQIDRGPHSRRRRPGRSCAHEDPFEPLGQRTPGTCPARPRPRSTDRGCAGRSPRSPATSPTQYLRSDSNVGPALRLFAKAEADRWLVVAPELAAHGPARKPISRFAPRPRRDTPVLDVAIERV